MMEENVPNEPGTIVWKLLDTNEEAIGEQILAWSVADGDITGRDWSRAIQAWRVAPFLPGKFLMLKVESRDRGPYQVNGATTYERNAQAAEVWNEYVLDNGVQPGTTVAEFRGELTPIPDFDLGREEPEEAS